MRQRIPLRGPHIPSKEARSSRNTLLTYYAERIGVDNWQYQKADKVTVTFPAVVSFIDNPDETLRALREMVASCKWGTREIFLDHGKCTQIDHGAASVVAALATAAQTRLIDVNGRNPKDPTINEMMWAVGPPRVLKYARTDIPEHFESFQLKRISAFTRTHARQSSPHELVAHEVHQHICKCVTKFGVRLTAKSQARLLGLLGEVCGNAEEHPGRPDWWVSAYLRQSTGQEGACHLTIFTIGETIYETLDGSLPSGCFMRDKIQNLVDTHVHRGLFRGNAWTEGNLWTLCALQEGVHRRNHDGDPAGRGNGTVQLMKYFRELSGDNPTGGSARMCIVSGNTQILFDGTYWPEETETETGTASVIAFNRANDLTRRPDDRYVRQLREFFPGTVISLRYPLSRGDLERSVETDEIG